MVQETTPKQANRSHLVVACLGGDKTALERSAKAIELKPSAGMKTKKATAKLVDGLTCEVTEEGYTFTSDMHPHRLRRPARQPAADRRRVVRGGVDQRRRRRDVGPGRPRS